MSFQTRHPKMGPVRFIPANDTTLPAVYSTFPSVRGFFKERLQYWQVKDFYYQKWNSEDTITLYFDSAANPVELYAVDTQGREIDLFGGRISMSPLVTESANTFDNGGGTEQYYTYYQTIYPASYAIPDGVYFLCLDHSYGGAVYTEVSEPIHIRAAKWTDTRLIEYTNSRNELVMDYILWEQVAAAIGDPMVLGLRVEAHVDDGEPFSADTQFVDMGEAVINLQSHPYQVYNFCIGTKGVPAWLLNKAAAALSCNIVSIDGQSFVKDQGATFAVKKFDTSGFRGATVKLRDADPENAGVIAHGAAVLLMELIGDGGDPELPVFPCAWNCLAVTETRLGSTGTSAPKVFNSLVDLDSYIAVLNTDLTTAFTAGSRMRGYITRVGLKIYYNNSIGERWIKWTAAHSFSYSAFDGLIDTTVRATGSNTLSASIWPTTGGGTRTQNAIVDYGDGTVIAITQASGATSINHTFPSSSDYNMRIFHAGSNTAAAEAIGTMQFGQIFPAPDTNIIRVLPGSHAPAALEAFRIFNATNGLGTGGGAADFQFLADAVLTLTNLQIFDTSITSSSDNIFDSIVYSALNDVRLLLGTATAEVNNIVNSFATYVAYSPSMTGGQFQISGGGSAPPTGAALTFLDVTLAGLPCSVVHD